MPVRSRGGEKQVTNKFNPTRSESNPGKEESRTTQGSILLPQINIYHYSQLHTAEFGIIYALSSCLNSCVVHCLSSVYRATTQQCKCPIWLWTNFGPQLLSCNISNTKKSVSSDIQTLRVMLKKRGAADYFLTNFEVFGCLMKHSFECLIQLLSIASLLLILGANQSKSSPNFMIITIT